MKKKFHGVTELPFILSNRLKDFLREITHPIAKKLIETDDNREDKKVTFVDFSDESKNKFSLINANKAYDNIKDIFSSSNDVMGIKLKLDQIQINDNVLKKEYWTKNRANVKIGSFINKVFPGEYKQGGSPEKKNKNRYTINLQNL